MTSSATTLGASNILPILQDGQQKSRTHYWLLPDKEKPAAQIRPFQMSANPHDQYGNLPDLGVSGFANRGYSGSVASVPPSPVHQHSGPSQQQAELLRSRATHGLGTSNQSTGTTISAFLSDQDNFDLSNVSDSPKHLLYSRIPRGGSQALAVGATSAAHRSLAQSDSLGEVSSKVKVIQGQVHGVTNDECLAALQGNQWHVDTAVRYLKVEQLFRLSIASREKCQSLLELFHWNLEMAGSALLDKYSVGSAV